MNLNYNHKSGAVQSGTDYPIAFVHTLCLTAQIIDGHPVYLLDEIACYRFGCDRRSQWL